MDLLFINEVWVKFSVANQIRVGGSGRILAAFFKCHPPFKAAGLCFGCRRNLIDIVRYLLE